jgi:hypothetical protein
MIERVQRKGRRVQRIARRPARVARTRVKLPPAKESGPTYPGARGTELRQGSHVRYATGRATGTITKAGPQQSEVKWHRNGITQSEVNSHLERIT